jgi:hypothetical protein
MRKTYLAGFSILFGCASAVAQSPNTILPGFLDLPLRGGQVITVHGVDYPFRFASISSVDRDEQIGPEPYVDALRALGWTDSRVPGLHDGVDLYRGEGADMECLKVGGGLTITTHSVQPPHWTVTFQQWPCLGERLLFPGLVDLEVVPGNWVEAHTDKFARIITTEGFRQRMFEVYVEELERMGWGAVEQRAEAVLMRRGADRPCLGVLHYKDGSSRLNLVDFHFSPAGEPCSLPPARE